MQGLTRKEVVYILRRRVRSGVNPMECQLLDLEANRIERMTDEEFKVYAQNKIEATGPTVINKRN